MSEKYYRYGHIEGIMVKVGQKVKRGQQIAKNGTGNGQWYAHCHFDIFKIKPGVYTEYCIGKSKNWVSDHYSDPRGLEKIVMPTFDHLGLGWLEYWDYATQSKKTTGAKSPCYHPGLDLNGKGSGNADLNDPIYSACDGEVVYIYNGTGKNSGWGKLIVIKEIEEIKKEEVKKPEEKKEEIKEPEKKEEVAPIIEEVKQEPKEEKITDDVELINNCQAIAVDLKFLIDRFLALFNKFFNKK
ncbi:MAG: peptidoglycan DD-metalloendopeptidase family protein [Candidatus Moraniibacteriota bacterium]